jgi:hypothetical protein
MEEEVEAPDTSEPFQAHAYWALMFNCDGCSAGMELPSVARQFSRAWFEKMAADAKQTGWTVYDPEGLGWFFECYCPKCSAQGIRKKKENSFRFEVRQK